MGWHRVEDDVFTTAPLARVRPRPFWARIWGNPLSLAAAGLALSIVVVIAAWFFVGGSSPSADGVPVAGHSTAPIDVVISTAPEPSDAQTEPSSSPSPRRSPSAVPSPSRSVRPTEPAAVATFTVGYSTGSAWGEGFIGQFTVTNTSTVSGRWVLTATFPDGVRVGHAWNGRDCSAPQNVFLAVADRDLPAGQSVIVGFQGSYQRKPATLEPSPYGIQAGAGNCPGQQ